MAGPDIINPHDRFFRAAMEYKSVAVDFFNHYLPKKIHQALDFDSLNLTKQSYINSDLQESISDLVFNCQLADKAGYLSLLIEHQSSPDKMMPFRAHHYLFGLLHSYRKQHPERLLPPVYILVFYHGEVTPYPYSLALWDCFDDPLSLMQDSLYQPLPLVDINQLSDEALKQQQWVGPMALALKHIRKRDLTPYAIEILNTLLWSLEDNEAAELIKLLLHYLLKVGNIDDVSAFIKTSTEQLPKPVRNEIMTFAEQLERQGRQKGWIEGLHEGKLEGWQEAKRKIALTMLEEGADPSFVSKTTGLVLADIEYLQTSLSDKV